jgi:hypothetical protein
VHAWLCGQLSINKVKLQPPFCIAEACAIEHAWKVWSVTFMKQKMQKGRNKSLLVCPNNRRFTEPSSEQRWNVFLQLLGEAEN